MKAQELVDRIQRVIDKSGNPDIEIEAYASNIVPGGVCYRIEQPLWVELDNNKMMIKISPQIKEAPMEMHGGPFGWGNCSKCGKPYTDYTKVCHYC
jgi:hypothetical protein